MKRRVVVPLAVAVLAGAWWTLRERPETIEAPQREPVAAAAPEAAPAVQRPAAPAAPAQQETAEEQQPIAALEGPASVVPIQPHDEVPALPKDDGPAHENDPIEPELPQTAEWKHGKTVHIAAALDRHVDRIEARRLAAVESGDAAEARRLEILVERQRQRLAAIREDAMRLEAEAALEGGEELVAAP